MNIETKCSIILELWDTYPDHKDFADLFSYGEKIDVLYLAQRVDLGKELDEESKSVINEFWTLFLLQLGLRDDIDYADLTDVISEARSSGWDWANRWDLPND
jgi:hypothetical protein